MTRMIRTRIAALLLAALLLPCAGLATEAEEEVSFSEEDYIELEHIDEEDPAGPEELPAGPVPEVVGEDNPQSQYTPNFGSPYYGMDPEMNYWTLPMDITDEAAVWEMLMQPMTVVDTGKSGSEKTQLTIYAEPDEDSAGVGVVTCVSQGVHVLQTLEGGWSLIECYSSSFHNSKVKAWNMLVQGYIQTKYLKKASPNRSYAIVIDKLTQRLYLFKEGRLYATLLVSTGLSNPSQPYNETRSGEFLMQLPAVGGFKDGSMVVSMAIRFNSGDLLHEVPHTESKYGKNYSTFEPKLGTRASHGCIRVQRNKTPEGVNMQWIWNNRKDDVKLVIWEDWQGRQIPYPAEDTPLYYNPKGGEMYHSSATCYSAVGRTFTPFTYGELDEAPFASLTRCDFCNPPLRRAEIDEINALHAPGGDHDPILTEARRQQQLEQ